MTYATERASVLFGCYRRGDANDPDQYVASIAAVLSVYETSLIREVTDPRTGISTDERYCTFMPNSGELKVYCDAIRERRHRYNRLGQLRRLPVKPLPLDTTQPGRRANVFVRPNAPQYPRVCELVKNADPADWKRDPAGRPGIWIALHLFERPAKIGEFAPLTNDQLSASPYLEAILRQEEAAE